MKEDGTIGPATAGFPNPAGASAAARALRAAAIACFVVCGAVVLYGIYLIVPQVH